MGNVLLIYPVGNSDFNLDGESSRFFGSFRANIQYLIKAEIVAPPPEQIDAGLTAINITWTDGTTKQLTFPMVDPVLRYVRGEHPEACIRLRFIVTNQTDERQRASDTFDFDRLINRYLAVLPAAVSFGDVEVVQAVELGRNPASHDDVVQLFREKVVPVINADLTECRAAYYSSAAGTPAMVFGAAMTLGSDARIEFIYKPNPTPMNPRDRPAPPRTIDPPTREQVMRVVPVTGFRREHQQRTLNLLDAALAQFDFTVAADLLDDPSSGFDPNDRRIREKVPLLRLYRDWHGELFRDGITAAQSSGLNPNTFAVGRLAQSLQVEPTALPKDRWEEFWRVKLLDIALRLSINLGLEDVPGFIDRLRHFLDVNQLWAFCWYGLARSPRCEAGYIDVEDRYVAAVNRRSRRVRTADEIAKDLGKDYHRQIFFRWRVQHAAAGEPYRNRLKAWYDHLWTFNRVATDGLRDYRNQHVHNAAQLERAFLNGYVANLMDAVQLGPGDPAPLVRGVVDEVGGATLIFGLVLDILTSLPGDSVAEARTMMRECLDIPSDLADPDRGFNLVAPAASAVLRDRLLEIYAGTSAAVRDFAILASKVR